jgi:D-3-phosphoglycerate dehydrogenase
MKFKVIKVDNRYEDICIEEKILNEVDAELLGYNLNDEDKIIEVTEDADGIITDLSPITEKVIKKLKKCKVISKVGIGVDNINVKAATEKGIPVCNVPDYCVSEVSDHTIALILSLVRKINYMNNLVKGRKWGIDYAKPIEPINEMILGLVGFGSIARLVYLKAKTFNFNILLFDPYINKDIENKYEIKLVDFNYLLEKSDIISIHCPANSETRHLFSYEQFKKMKKNSYLINTSRGMIIDNIALYLALKEKIIAGAAVDVYDPEPINFKDPILKLDNFIITPHLGFYSEKSIRELRTKSALNVARVLSNKEPINIVNRKSLKKEV